MLYFTSIVINGYLEAQLQSADPKRPKLKVFISYSRKDLNFADRLVAALEVRGLDVLIDRRNLPTLEDWERELLHFIRTSDTVIFIVSKSSVRSPACEWEVQKVRENSKRLAPIVIDDVAELNVPRDIAKINYLFFTNNEDFEKKADDLALALKLDTVWLKEHTRLSEMARRWLEAGRPDDSLIRGRELNDAERWALQRSAEAPSITAVLHEFIQTSRRHEEARLVRETRQRKRFRRVSGGALILGVATAGAGYAWWQNDNLLKGTCSVSKKYTYPTGRFVKTTLGWQEYKDTQLFATFDEFRQDATHIYLADKNRLDPLLGQGRSQAEAREMWIRIPKCGGQVEWTWSNPLVWTPFQMVDRG